MSQVSDPAFWSNLYQSNEAGWDKGRCAPPIQRMLHERVIPAGGQVAVVGCGRGHEALAATQCGYGVTAVDFAPEAIAAVREKAATLGLSLNAVEADVFALAERWPATFDAVIEHTCLCAIDQQRRNEYVNAVHGALKPGGVLLGLLYAHNRPDGPPYAITERQARELFEAKFVFERLCIASDSFENRTGNEIEFIARRRD